MPAAPGTPAPYRVYNLGGARPVTLDRLLALLEEALGRRARVVRLPPQPGDVPRTAADLERSGRELGYAPRVSLEEGLRRTLHALGLAQARPIP